MLVQEGESERWEAWKWRKECAGDPGLGGSDVKWNYIPAVRLKFQVLGCMIVTQSYHHWVLGISLKVFESCLINMLHLNVSKTLVSKKSEDYRFRPVLF